MQLTIALAAPTGLPPVNKENLPRFCDPRYAELVRIAGGDDRRTTGQKLADLAAWPPLKARVRQFRIHRIRL